MIKHFHAFQTYLPFIFKNILLKAVVRLSVLQKCTGKQLSQENPTTLTSTLPSQKKLILDFTLWPFGSGLQERRVLGHGTPYIICLQVVYAPPLAFAEG